MGYNRGKGETIPGWEMRRGWRLFSSAARTQGTAKGLNVGRLDNGVGLASVDGSGPFYGAGVLIGTGEINGQIPANPIGTASSYILGKLAFKVSS